MAAGLTPGEALRAATAEPAAYVDRSDALGTIAAGKAADLVLRAASPLEDIRNTRRIRAVVRDGRLHDRAELDAILARLAAAAASPAE